MLNLALSPIHVVDGTKVHYVLNNELTVFIFASFIQLQKKSISVWHVFEHRLISNF